MSENLETITYPEGFNKNDPLWTRKLLWWLLDRLNIELYSCKSRDGKYELYLRREGRPEENLNPAILTSLRWRCVEHLEEVGSKNPGAAARFNGLIRLMAESNPRETEIETPSGESVFREFVNNIVDGVEGAPDGVIGITGDAVTLIPMLPTKLAELVVSTMEHGDMFARDMPAIMKGLGFHYGGVGLSNKARTWTVKDPVIHIGLRPDYYWETWQEYQKATNPKTGKAKTARKK